MATSSEWLDEFSELTGVHPVTALNIARALRGADLYSRPSRGAGHRKTQVTADDLVNFILAQAATQASDAAEVVTQLRNMRFNNTLTDRPVIQGDTLGDTLAQFISGAANVIGPDVIMLSTQPFSAMLIWSGPGEGAAKRGAPKAQANVYVVPQLDLLNDNYTPPWDSSAYVLKKTTTIRLPLLDLAQRMLRTNTAHVKRNNG